MDVASLALEWARTRRPSAPPIGLVAVVTEGIWIRSKYDKDGASPQNIAALSFTAGRQISGWGVPQYRLPIPVWRNALMYSGGTLPKLAFLARYRMDPIFCGTGGAYSDDEIEGVGIAVALIKLGFPKQYLLKEAP